MKKDRKSLTITDQDNIVELATVDTDKLESFLKLMALKIDSIGGAILTEDLSRSSFANVGIALAKYQGAEEIYNLMVKEVRAYKAKSQKDG